MDFAENRRITLAKVYETYPDAESASFGGFRGDLGFWVHLKDGACVFFRMIEPVKFIPTDGSLFWLFDE